MACQAESSEMNIAMPRGDIRDFPFVVKQKINGEMVLYTGDFDDIYFTVKTNFAEKEYVFRNVSATAVSSRIKTAYIT